MLLSCLKESRQGMTSLTKTYEEDRMFVSEVETLRDMVGLKVVELQEQKEKDLPSHGNNSLPVVIPARSSY